MTPTEMHIDALMEKIEDLELKISLMIDPIVFNSMSAEYADHLSRLSDQNKKLEAENARYREALKFYADEKNWLGYHDRCTDVLNDDVPSIASDGFKIVVGGRRAREALKGE